MPAVLHRENAIDVHGSVPESIKSWSISQVAKKSVEEVDVFVAPSYARFPSQLFLLSCLPYKHIFHVCPSATGSAGILLNGVTVYGARVH